MNQKALDAISKANARRFRYHGEHTKGCQCADCVEVELLCPDSPDGNHHLAPIGSDEEWMPSKAPCYYCGEKQAL